MGGRANTSQGAAAATAGTAGGAARINMQNKMSDQAKLQMYQQMADYSVEPSASAHGNFMASKLQKKMQMTESKAAAATGLKTV